MSFSLYDATIPNYCQILGSLAGLLTKAEAFCQEKRLAPDEIIQARLAPDMLPFAYQVKSAAVHSVGAIEGVRKGVFTPDMTTPPGDFAALQALTARSIATLEAIKPAEVESFIGRDMRFSFGDYRVDFTAENFLLTFSQANFFFHSVTAYDILRWKGVGVGKLDYLGRMRKKA